MTDCTERSEGQEGMTGGTVMTDCTERHPPAAHNGVEGQKGMPKEGAA